MGAVKHANMHVGLGGYIATWAALMALTGLTFGLSFAPMGAWEMPVSLLIACAKSLLVVLLFMHLIEQGTTPRSALVVGLSFVALLCALTILDAAQRQHDAVPPQLTTPHTPIMGGETPQSADDEFAGHN